MGYQSLILKSLNTWEYERSQDVECYTFALGGLIFADRTYRGCKLSSLVVDCAAFQMPINVRGAVIQATPLSVGLDDG